MNGIFRSWMLAVFLLMQLQGAFGQERKISGYIFSKASKEPLPFATIRIGMNKITDANDVGFYNILVDKNDTLLFSFIGYQEKIIKATELKDGDSLFLDAKDFILPEVLVGKTKTIEIGELNDKKKFDINCPCSTRYEMATKINVSPQLKKYQVKKLQIRGFGFNPENPVRIHLYSVGSFGEPLNDLLKKDIVITEDLSKNGILEIDVDDQNIILDLPSFFISVQWISDNYNQDLIRKGKRPIPKRPAIYGTYSFKNAETYIREKTQKFGYIWAFYAYSGSYIVLYPFNFKRPGIGEKSYKMLVSAELTGL